MAFLPRTSLAVASALGLFAAISFDAAAARPVASAVASGAAPVGSNVPGVVRAAPLPMGADQGGMPAGHPTVPAAADGNEDDQDDPNVAPGMGGAAGASGSNAANPHASAPGIFQPPEDVEQEAADLPPGTIAVRIVDADERPIAHAPITLGILHNTVAKGESREKVVRDAGDDGTYIFPNLVTGSGIAYRISSPKDGGTYAATPFQLPPQKGMRVVLHVYDASPHLEDARIVMQTAVYVEMKDDRVQLEEVFAIFNFGKVSWLPSPDLVIDLPPEYTAFNTQQEMSDTGADPIPGRGIKLHGTFGPGRHDVSFRWQLPYSGDADVKFDVGLPPHVASSRVLAAAAPGMHLDVHDFPTAAFRPDAQGTRVLATEKQVRPNDPPLATLHISLRDLPTAGPGRFIATGLASVGVFAGLAFVFGRRSGSSASRGRARGDKAGRKAERARLLEELEELEQAHQAGEIGPKTYDKARREIISAIAKTLEAAEPPATPLKTG